MPEPIITTPVAEVFPVQAYRIRVNESRVIDKITGAAGSRAFTSEQGGCVTVDLADFEMDEADQILELLGVEDNSAFKASVLYIYKR